MNEQTRFQVKKKAALLAAILLTGIVAILFYSGC
jgi:hypothetical protein